MSPTLNLPPVLNAPQQLVTRRVLGEEGDKRYHLVIALSGAHAYGFPSPDSDLDLKAIHIAPTRSLLSLAPGRATFDRMEVLDGVEIDYTSNELQMAISGMLGGNGNYLERVLGALQLSVSPELDSLRPLMQKAVCKKVHHHYRGFATSQLKEAEKAPQTPAKKVLYVLRTALTGAHLLRTSRMVIDLTELLDEYGFGEARRLVEAKKAGEKAPLSEAERAHWLAQTARAFEVLDAAAKDSALPAEPPNVEAIEGWLLELRRARF